MNAVVDTFTLDPIGKGPIISLFRRQLERHRTLGLKCEHVFTLVCTAFLAYDLKRSLGNICSLSSVVEHYLDTVGATGSNPVGCTIP
jgi:hypothetical protein